MPAFAQTVPLGPSVPSNDEGWLYQYDLDPATLTPFNVVGNWGYFNNQPNYVNAGFFGNGFGAPPALNDSIEFRFVMTEGLYRLRLWSVRTPDGGTISLTMNGYTIENSLAFYAPAPSYSYILLELNRYLVPAGLQKLVFTVNGKAAGSSNYYFRLYGVQFAPYLPNIDP
jgi:hypothetical protein